MMSDRNKKWYTVEIEYNVLAEVKLMRIPNLDGYNLKLLRENMFISGVYRKIDECTGEILSPYQIRKTTVYLQKHFFGQDDLNAKLEQDKNIH